MRRERNIALRLIGLLTGLAAVLTFGVAIFVYSGQEHRDAATSIAREFFVLMERASLAKSPLVNASPSPKQEGATIQ